MTYSIELNQETDSRAQIKHDLFSHMPKR